MARDEPRRQHLMASQHIEQPLGSYLAELAARDRARRPGFEWPDPDGYRVKVKGQTNRDALCHGSPPDGMNTHEDSVALGLSVMLMEVSPPGPNETDDSQNQQGPV